MVPELTLFPNCHFDIDDPRYLHRRLLVVISGVM